MEEARSTTSEQVRRAAQAIYAGALLGVPAGVELAVAGVTPVPRWSSDAVPGRVFERRSRRSQQPKGARLVVGDDGLSLHLGGGELTTVRWADAIGLLELAPGEWTLAGGDGTTLALTAGDWQDGSAAVDLVLAAVPPELQVAADHLRTDGQRVLLLHAPPHSVGEALWPSSSDAWVLKADSWTAVVREQDGVEAYAAAAGMSAALGRRCAVLLLEQSSEELSVVVLHRGEERDRHVWTGEEHDPSVLAEVLRADPAQVASLLAEPGAPAEVLAAMTRTLGVPGQVVQVLAGVPVTQVPGFVCEPARNLRQSVAAAVRGEYDPPDSTRLDHRMLRWERERPPAYRAANAAAAAGQAALAVRLAVRAEGQWSRRTTSLVAFFAVGALGSLWSVRPPRR